MTTVTVIIPVKNRAEFLKRCLASIDSQRNLRTPVEVIVVDDNSSDETPKVARQWVEKRHQDFITARLATASGHGASAARNHGAILATGSWLLFFDSDDVMLPDHLSNVTKAINQNEGKAEVIGWDVIHLTGRGRKKEKKFKTKDILYEHIIHGQLATQRYCLKRSTFLEIGKCNDQLTGWIDYELGMRLLLAGARIAVAEGGPGAEVTIHDESITGSAFSHYPERWERSLDAVRKEVEAANRPDVMKWVDLRAVILAGDYYNEGATDEAKRLLTETLERVGDEKTAQLLRRLYKAKIVLKRGTGRLARHFMPVPSDTPPRNNGN